jgi:hypothetical protein
MSTGAIKTTESGHDPTFDGAVGLTDLRTKLTRTYEDQKDIDHDMSYFLNMYSLEVKDRTYRLWNPPTARAKVMQLHKLLWKYFKENPDDLRNNFVSNEAIRKFLRLNDIPLGHRDITRLHDIQSQYKSERANRHIIRIIKRGKFPKYNGTVPPDSQLVCYKDNLYTVPNDDFWVPETSVVKHDTALKRKQFIEKRARQYKTVFSNQFQNPRVWATHIEIKARGDIPWFGKLEGTQYENILRVPAKWDKLAPLSTPHYLLASFIDGTEIQEFEDDMKLAQVFCWKKSDMRKRPFPMNMTNWCDDDANHHEVQLHPMWLAYTPSSSSITPSANTALKSLRTKTKNDVINRLWQD